MNPAVSKISVRTEDLLTGLSTVAMAAYEAWEHDAEFDVTVRSKKKTWKVVATRAVEK